MTSVTVIGAGNGGLTTAAVLAEAGLDVTVLEAHSYPGGCAGTFRRKRYRFEAGATLAGGFNPGEVMDIIARKVGISSWKAHFDTPAMSVHLPNGMEIPRYGDKRRWDIRMKYFGEKSLSFWKWQEKTADAFWDLALRSPPFPPQNSREFRDLIDMGIIWIANQFNNLSISTIRDAVVPLASRLTGQSENLRRFVDAQLLISTQTISHKANALFGASALDLPRRGVVHMEGGIGTIARQLEQAVINHSGQVLYKQQVDQLIRGKNKQLIRTKKGLELYSDIVVANITPWNIKELLSKNQLPSVLKKLPHQPKGGWGAFVVYLGISENHLPEDTPLHHQILANGPLTEGNSIFISLSPTWDDTRAPSGKRAITISTHTNLAKWWFLYQSNPVQYEREKQLYVNKILSVAHRVFPDISKAELIEAGTPLTFNHFTNRKFGWVGGFRQEHLLKTFGPYIADGIWMVGDSIFPGQSTAAVSLGGLRVARSILQKL